jgi:hypothetical protein
MNQFGLMNYAGSDVMTFRVPPKPTQWVHFVADKIDVCHLFSLDWAKFAGPRYHHAVVGIVEAIERLSEHGHFSWLRILPLASKSGLKPHINKKVGVGANKKATNEAEDFVETAKSICAMIHEQYELYLSSATSTMEVIGSTDMAVIVASIANEGNDNVDPGNDIISPDLIGLGNLADEDAKEIPLKLVRRWIRAIVVYAPTLPILSALIDTNLAQYSEFIRKPFCVRLEDETFRSDKDFEVLFSLMNNNCELCGPAVAAALLKNSSGDEYPGQVLNFVRKCVQLGLPRHDATSIALLPADRQATTPLGSIIDVASDMDALTGDWLDLNSACKEWIQRCHSTEPAPPMETVGVNDNSYGLGWSLIGGYGREVKRTKPKELTEEELAKQRQEGLHNALGHCDVLLQLPVVSKFPQGILFELSRCWFLNGSINSVLETIFAEATTGPSPFSTYSGAIGSFMENKVIKIIRESISFKQNMLTIASAANRILSKSSPLFHTVMLHLIVFSTTPELHSRDISVAELIADSALYPPPALRSILDNHHLWAIFVGAVIDHPVASAMFSTILIGASGVLTSVAEAIIDDSVTVGQLNVLSHAVESFTSLLSVFRCTPSKLTLTMIESRLAGLTRFDRQLEEVQTYASFFCSCGVRMNATDVRGIVDSVRSKYQSLRSSELSTAFSGVSALLHIPQLYELRGSEIFLQLWTKVGKELCFEHVAALNAPANTDVTANPFVHLGGLFGEPEADQPPADPQQPPPQAPPANPLIDDLTEEEEAQLPEDVRAQRAAIRFLRQQQQHVLQSQVEDVVLDQSTVVLQLIPRVRKQWEDLATEIFEGQISIHLLDKVFSKKSFGLAASAQLDAKLSEELNLMIVSYQAKNDIFMLNRSAASIAKSKTLVQTSFERIRDFLLLRRLCKWLPSIIALHDIVASLCSTAPENDTFRCVLVNSLQEIQSGWENQTLESIPGLVDGVKGIFGMLSGEQLDFVSMLSSSPNLMNWLLARSSTEEFNRLLQVVRPCTDEPRLLSAIASLVHVRTLLLNPLYVSPPFLDLEQFLASFQHLDMGSAGSQQSDSALWHVNNVISSFDALMDIFEKQTRSPGIKSCFDLKAIRDRGTFILRSKSDSSKVLTVEIASTASNVAVDDGSHGMDDKPKVETLEYLLDLRSKLLMTEIPPELEDEMQASSMVESFVIQLQVLSEICDVIATLNSSGNVKYQDDFSLSVRFTLDGLSSLRDLHSRLQSDSQAWAAEVRENRAALYFLNYFTMREILKMRSIVLGFENFDKVAGKPEGTQEPAPAADRLQSPSVAVSAAQSDEAESIALARQLEMENNSSAAVSDVHEFSIAEMEQMGFSRETAMVALYKSNYDLNNAIDYCFANSLALERIVAEEFPVVLAAMEYARGGANSSRVNFNSGGDSGLVALKPYEQIHVEFDAVQEIQNFLHQISTNVSKLTAQLLIDTWKPCLESNESILSSLGNVLEIVFKEFATPDICDTKDIAEQVVEELSVAEITLEELETSKSAQPAVEPLMRILASALSKPASTESLIPKPANRRKASAEPAVASKTTASAAAKKVTPSPAKMPSTTTSTAAAKTTLKIAAASKKVTVEQVQVGIKRIRSDSKASSASSSSATPPVSAPKKASKLAGKLSAKVSTDASIASITEEAVTVGHSDDPSSDTEALSEPEDVGPAASGSLVKNDRVTSTGTEVNTTTGTEAASPTSMLHMVRKLQIPGSNVANRGDLLYVIDNDTEKRLPVFVSCTDDPNLVIDTVLSIYIRRGRLPEPGEILFCTTDTTSEELNIFLLRFILAKKHGFESCIFCIADLHNLSYTQQCNLIELLRGLIQTHGHENAATLAIISGLPRQMALNSLSSQHIDLPPLPVKYLRTACKEAFEKHCGVVSKLIEIC